MYSGANVVSQNLWAVCALLNGTIDAITLLGGMSYWSHCGCLRGPKVGPNDSCWCILLKRNVLGLFGASQCIHCSQVGLHLGTLVPMETKISFLVPIWSPFFSKVPIFSILGLRTRQKSVQPLSNVNHLIEN